MLLEFLNVWDEVREEMRASSPINGKTYVPWGGGGEGEVTSHMTGYAPVLKKKCQKGVFFQTSCLCVPICLTCELPAYPPEVKQDLQPGTLGQGQL